jgi:SAM-dependent methyltransferase
MGIGYEIMVGLCTESVFKPFYGTAYTLGRQTMALNPADTARLLDMLHVPKSVGSWTEADFSVDKTTDFALKYSDTKHVTDVSFLRAFNFDKVYAIDISDFEGAEIVTNLNNPIPANLESTCDFLLDGSTLDNIFDPVTGLRNIARLLKPGGRAFLNNLGNYSKQFNGIPYTMFNPLWFYDYFVWNNFSDVHVYCSVYESAGSGSGSRVYKLLHSHARRKWDGGYIAPLVSEGPIAVTVFVEKGPDSTWDLSPSQHAYRPADEWARFEQIVERIESSSRPDVLKGTRSDVGGDCPQGWMQVA